ncbi:MAG: hypothetical protein RLY86_2244 [Pseudomonadota bacterium]
MGDIVSIADAAKARGGRLDGHAPIHGPIQARVQIVRERRAAWGRAMRARRMAAGLTTRHVADGLGLRSPTLLSAIEQGRGHLPDGKLADWARVIGVDPRIAAKEYLSILEPVIYTILFDRDAQGGGGA